MPNISVNSQMVFLPSKSWGTQPWALSFPDKELCLWEALAVCIYLNLPVLLNTFDHQS